jgi:tetratricopeptide (TPR) repeat protein
LIGSHILKLLMLIHSAIQDAIKRSNLVFFVGAGFSKSLGLPAWMDLVKLVVDDLRRDYGNSIDALMDGTNGSAIGMLDALKKNGHHARIVEVMERYIHVSLERTALRRHEKIWQITDQVITTNYDKAFETVGPAKMKKIVYEDDFHIAQLSGLDHFLFKVHGCIEQPGKCILFSDQYKKLYHGRHGASLELFKFLSDTTIIFLGFSLSDPFVNDLLKLRQKAYRGLKPPNFIITMGDNDFSELGVEKIQGVTNYDVDLDAFLDALIAIREKYPPGLSMLLQGLKKEGRAFVEEEVREQYFGFLSSIETQPARAEVAEEIKTGHFPLAEEKLRDTLKTELNAIEINRKKAAHTSFELGKFKELQARHKESLPYYEQAVKLQPNNPDYLNGLGCIHYYLGDPRMALQYHQKASRINRRQFGERHATHANDLYSVALPLISLGEYKKARIHLTKAIRIGSQTLGERHPEMGLYYMYLSNAFSLLNEPQKGLTYAQLALDIVREHFDYNHKKTAMAYSYMGHCYHGMLQIEKAHDCFKKSLEIDSKIYSDNHPELAQAYNNFACTLTEMGKNREALSYYKKCLAIDEYNFGAAHPNIATRHSNIGSVWANLGNYQKAIASTEKSLAMNIKFFGKKHLDVAGDYYSLGLFKREIGDHKGAIENFHKAVSIYAKHRDEAFSQLYSSIEALGESYYARKEFKKAIPKLETMCVIYFVQKREGHAAFLVALDKLAIAYGKEGKLKRVIEKRQMALGILANHYKSRVEDISLAYTALGKAYENNQQYKLAIMQYEEALVRYEAKFKKTDERTKIVLTNIKRCRRKLAMGPS